MTPTGDWYKGGDEVGAPSACGGGSALMTLPEKNLGYKPETETNRRLRWMVGGVTILTFMALLYLVELIDQLTRHSWITMGLGC